jgi:hypothetical protein
MISCISPPGIGSDLRFYVTVAGQTSSATSTTSNLISYKLPKILVTSTATIGTEGGEISFTGTNFGLAVQGLEAKVWFGTKALLAVAKTQSDTPAPDGRDSITVRIPELVDGAMAMVNVSSMLEISSGTTTLLSDPVLLSYMPPRVDKVYTYEGETSALKLVVEGSNFCGSIACGGVDVYDASAEKKPVAITRYVGDWTHSRVEFEIGVDKGTFQMKVGSSTYGYQMSPSMTFEHKSPVIDNKAELAAGLYSTKGGDVVTIKGRYFRKENVEVWVGDTKSPNVVSVVQNLELGYHHYTVVALMPPGQGRDNRLRIVLPSEGAVAATESEFASVSYKPPSKLVQNSHTFPTTGGSVTFTGVDLGLCALLVVDGATVTGTGTGENGCYLVENHAKVTLDVPDGDGRGHSMSIIVGDQLPLDWAIDDAQCEKGRGIAAGGGGDFGWFSFASPVVTSISPATIDTSAMREMVIHGRNFGVADSGPPTVSLKRRVQDESACTCPSKEETACLAGPGCTASVCCGENKGCGCFAESCGCCALATTCTVQSFNHTTIICEMQPGQGTDLEVSVTVNDEVSGGRAGATPVSFSFTPPTIVGVSPLSSPTRGGTIITIVGTSFGTDSAIVELLGDTSMSAQGTALADTIGPIALASQNHTHITFAVPEGQGHDRRVRVTVGGQSTIYGAASFRYDAPTFTKVLQPEACTTQVRTIACGSPTQGGFLLEFRGENFGVRGGGAKVVVDGTTCCDSSSASCDSIFSLAPYTDCACCVKSQTHESIKVLAPSGVGSAVPTLLTYGEGYKGWNFHSKIAYDPPWINFAQPQAGNANGDVVTLHGINFGNISGGGDVSSIRIGNRTCANVRWVGVGTDEAVACDLRQDNAGTKSVEITVGGQTMFWDADEWKKTGGHRIFRMDCPTHFFGKDNEPCFECPFVTDNDGVTVYDQKGDKQYMATCDQRGDPSRPEMVAKKGFYLMTVHRTCGNTGIACTNATLDCAQGETCDYDGSTGEEYCNSTLKQLRTMCQYVLSCEPAEACEANNVCSVIEEGARDPLTNKTIDPHGYANVTMGGNSVARCSACAVGYFRIGGLCEVCPKDILVIALIFLGGVVCLCGVGYVLHMFKVNLAMAAIGIDYAQVMSMFLKSEIRWPAAIRTLFRILSSLNFDLDIASPECLMEGLYRFDIKFYCILGLPIATGAIFLFAHVFLWCKKRFWEGRKKDLNRHAHAMVSLNLVMMYFLYLYLTRSALDVFNCVALDPPDNVHPDWTYMTAVGGERCYMEGGLQMQLLPLAVLAVIVYTIGYPSALLMLFWRNRDRIQRDQYLRACGKGDKRDNSDLFNVYHVRKRYSAIYYQFKPRCYYWTVVIIARKFAIAFVNLMLRQDVDYMLAASLLIMFISFSIQLLNRPFMGPAEYAKVRKNWGDRTAGVSSVDLRGNGGGGGGGGVSRNKGQYRTDGVREYRSSTVDPNRASALARIRIVGISGTKKMLMWLVNYNTVESILLFCSVLVMLGGIMFSSERFDNNKNQSELETITWTVLFVIVFSGLYYATVLSLEIFAQTCPGVCKRRCKCDLEKHLGDGFVSRTKVKMAEKLERQTRLRQDASKIEKKALELRSYAQNPMNNGKNMKDAKKKAKKAKGKKKKKAKDEASVGLVGGKPGANEAGWTTHLDVNTGKQYYHHGESGRTTWSEGKTSSVPEKVQDKRLTVANNEETRSF